jgi:phosphoglucomutase
MQHMQQTMTTPNPLAGKPAPASLLIDVDALRTAYAERLPNPANPDERVAFGTSGHRGSPLKGSFNRRHVQAIAQAIADRRDLDGLDGPLFLGRDTHAVSPLAEETVLEVLAANGVDVVVQSGGEPTPTPVVSWRILVENDGPTAAADGILITPSHNPPEDGGIKYNPPEGGPAPSETTRWIEERANQILEAGEGDEPGELAEVMRMPIAEVRRQGLVREEDMRRDYVRDLDAVVDMEAIAKAGLNLAADPLGGAALGMWDLVNEIWGTSIATVNREVDPAFSFMRVDHDG